MFHKPTFEELERKVRELEKAESERRLEELYRALSAEVLLILNESADFESSIKRVLAAVRQTTGCDAVGLRLHSGEDFPYFLQDGFGDDFLLTENSLLERDRRGEICRNPDGTVRLECACGLVISGKVDHSNPLFTPGGSAWTNDSFPFLDLPEADDPRHHPRNQCIHKGYASIALIPIRRKGNIVGLLQVNGHKEGLFTPAAIHALERIASDIGEALLRKQTEEALYASEEKYRKLVENAGQAIFVARGGRLIFHNNKMRELIGYSSDEIPSREFTEFIHPDDQVMVSERHHGRLKGDELPAVYEFRVVRRNGEVRWVSLNVVSIEWEGHPATLNFLSDISERVELEQRRQQIAKAESLTIMAGAIAHNFNNILSIVIGNLDLAMTDSLQGVVGGEELAHYLNEAMEGAGRAAEMSAFILAYTGQLQQKMEVHDLSEVCQGIVAVLKENMPSGIRLVADSPASLKLRAKVAPDLIRQALTHLVANAREAIEHEEGEIRVSIVTVQGVDVSTTAIWPPDWTPAAEEYAAIQVNDTGCGISAEDLGKVVDPFFSTKFTGRGIGLSVVLGIAQAHQGAVTVESEPGAGSTFQVLFPLADQQITSGLNTVIGSNASLETGGRILLIEDEEMVRNTMGAILRRLGFDVLMAGDGIEALDIFRSRPDEICLVITDLTMPRMNGWETLSALREIRPDIPVILASGYDEAHVMACDHAENPQAFLHKPFETEALLKTLESVLGLDKLRRSRSTA